ncbi:MAG: hypothetical protein ACLQOO_08925 [Terriglobia bacterium]
MSTRVSEGWIRVEVREFQAGTDRAVLAVGNRQKDLLLTGFPAAFICPPGGCAA